MRRLDERAAGDEPELDWSSALAREAAGIARRLIAARASLPSGCWTEADPEAAPFLELLDEACSRASADKAFLVYLMGSLAGHAYLFGSASGHPVINDLRSALDLAQMTNNWSGWVL